MLSSGFTLWEKEAAKAHRLPRLWVHEVKGQGDAAPFVLSEATDG